ncbi:MAG: chemotaxis protein CheA [Planctomycetota bacterium]|jgi:two-component system chemotaxis sensor kinase CheA
MQETDKLTELVNQAASAINMLNPTDMSELENLQTILDQVKQNVAQMSDGPAELLEQARGTTSDAVEALQKIFQSQTQDSTNLIEAITQAVSTLQGFTDEIAQTGAVSDSQPAQTGSAGDTETPAAQSIVIAEEDVSLVLDFVAEANEHIESVEAGLLELESKPGDKEVINKIFRGFHTIKGMAGFLNLAEIGSLAHSAENLLDTARKGKLTLAGENIDVVLEAADMMKKMVAGLKDSVEADKPVPSQKLLPQLLAKLTVFVEGQSPAAFLKSPQAQKKDRELDSILATKDQPKKQNTATTATKAQIRSSDEKIKVSTTRLDNLVNAVGELVVAQLMVTEEASTTLASDHNFCRKITHQGKIVRVLQQLSMSMRMVPIQGVFHKMARLVRDLSRKSGKDISFSTVGDQTELDRTVVDRITDPLVHMVRNSVDHGIEPAEERVKTGKDPAGRIELRAFHQAGNIVIEIEDDGKGLNKERILKKAIDNGIITADQELSDEETLKLVFHAGLSTAQKVTNISGRGVGMDVVKKNVESLRGRIEVSSTAGQGAVFTIRLPLTLAIIDGQIVRVGSNRYIVPINSIARSLKPTNEQLLSVQRRGEMAVVQGELIPIIRLYRLFGVVPTTEEATESLLVVVEDDSRKCCLLVDELLGQQQVVIKNLGEGLGKVKGISGGAIMGDGKVSLILDVPGLMELARKR